MTQKEFAEKLYVTESAVSKWERGMSYPDITLLLDICAALDVTEHELLTASVDTQKRAAERMAEKYQRLTRGFCIFMCIIFGGVLFGFGIAAIASHDLWFLPIAAASVMIAASLTLLPFLLARRPEWEPYKWAVSLGSMVGSVELLILLCCLRSGSMEWFPMVALWVLFGSSLLILPVILPMLPLPVWLRRRKASLCLAADTALLMLAVIANGAALMMAYGYELKAFLRWSCMTVTAVSFGAGFIVLPEVQDFAVDRHPVRAAAPDADGHPCAGKRRDGVLAGGDVRRCFGTERPVSANPSVAASPSGGRPAAQGVGVLLRQHGAAAGLAGHYHKGLVLPYEPSDRPDGPGPAMGADGRHPVPAGERVVPGIAVLCVDRVVELGISVDDGQGSAPQRLAQQHALPAAPAGGFLPVDGPADGGMELLPAVADWPGDTGGCICGCGNAQTEKAEIIHLGLV